MHSRCTEALTISGMSWVGLWDFGDIGWRLFASTGRCPNAAVSLLRCLPADSGLVRRSLRLTKGASWGGLLSELKMNLSKLKFNS